ncbi:hypothetical protein BDW71DRAFT_209667 [Aspergillus fruticulosus]
MHLFNPIDSLDPFASLSRRQSDSNPSSVCGGGGVGTGECKPGSSCKGILYAEQCQHSAEEECCLQRRCETDRGNGFCRNHDNQTCAGEYVVGKGPDFPCAGPNYILCCIEWGDMVNDTSTSNSSSSTLTMTTTATATNPPTPSLETGAESNSSGGSGEGGGLSTSQKGGIAGGVVGAVAVTSIIFLLVLLLRRKNQQQHECPGVEESEKQRDDCTGDGRGTERDTDGPDGGGGETEMEVAMLASREKAELDAPGRELHEMEASAVRRSRKEMGGLTELDGTPLAIAEMAVPENGAGRGRNGQAGHEQGT